MALVSGSLAGPVPAYCQSPGWPSLAQPQREVAVEVDLVGVRTGAVGLPVGVHRGHQPQVDAGRHVHLLEAVHDGGAGVLVAVDHADHHHLGAALRAPLDRGDGAALDGAAQLAPSQHGGRRFGGRGRHGLVGGTTVDTVVAAVVGVGAVVVAVTLTPRRRGPEVTGPVPVGSAVAADEQAATTVNRPNAATAAVRRRRRSASRKRGLCVTLVIIRYKSMTDGVTKGLRASKRRLPCPTRTARARSLVSP